MLSTSAQLQLSYIVQLVIRLIFLVPIWAFKGVGGNPIGLPLTTDLTQMDLFFSDMMNQI